MPKKERELVNAARTGDLSTIKQLLASEVAVDSKDEKGWTALLAAAYEGQEEVLTLLIENGANLNARTPENQTLLMMAAYNGSLPIVENLLEHGAPVNDKDAHGWTPLMFLTIYRHAKTRQVDLATRILAKGANASATNKAGWNAAMMARKNGMIELEQLLLGHTKSADEMTAESLLDLGADIALNPKKYDLE